MSEILNNNRNEAVNADSNQEILYLSKPTESDIQSGQDANAPESYINSPDEAHNSEHYHREAAKIYDNVASVFSQAESGYSRETLGDPNNIGNLKDFTELLKLEVEMMRQAEEAARRSLEHMSKAQKAAEESIKKYESSINAQP